MFKEKLPECLNCRIAWGLWCHPTHLEGHSVGSYVCSESNLLYYNTSHSNAVGVWQRWYFKYTILKQNGNTLKIESKSLSISIIKGKSLCQPFMFTM